MATADLDALRFPIGRFVPVSVYDAAAVSQGIASLAALPEKLRGLATGIRGGAWERTYRPGGWTLRQVAHHLVDSHINSYVRFKLALTEDNPVIKPYMEERWAELPDAMQAEARLALDLLSALHAKWVLCLRNMQDSEWNRSFFHPESKQNIYLYNAVALYAWHGEHHLAQMRSGLAP